MKRKKACRSCARLRKEVDALSTAMIEQMSFNRARTQELEVYRKMMSDLVDDYLIRRNPFRTEEKK